MPGVLRQVPKMLLDPAAPLHVPARYLFRAAPWFLRFVASARPAHVVRAARALADLQALAMEQHQVLAQEVGAPELIQARGHLHLYRNEAQLAKDAGSWELRRQHGGVFETIDRAAIAALEPAVGPAYQIGQFMPDHGHCVNPYRYCLAIAEALEQAGGRILQDEILAIESADGKATGATGRAGRYGADAVVLAGGAWSARLLEPFGYRIPLESQRGYHITLCDPGLTIGRCIVPADRKVFITPMEGGIRVAGTVEFGGLERPPTPRRARLLYDDARAVFPEATITEENEFWMGHRPCLPESVPVIGPASRLPGLWLAFGHGHLGLTGSAPTARLLAPAIMGQPANLDLSAYARWC